MFYYYSLEYLCAQLLLLITGKLKFEVFYESEVFCVSAESSGVLMSNVLSFIYVQIVVLPIHADYCTILIMCMH